MRVSAALAGVEGSSGDGYSMFGGDPKFEEATVIDAAVEGAAGGFGRRGRPPRSLRRRPRPRRRPRRRTTCSRGGARRLRRRPGAAAPTGRTVPTGRR
ncbi:MAG: hypothetical protein ACLR3C_01955 [Eggerthella lenta]